MTSQVVSETAGLIDALILRRMNPPDPPDHCRECGERIDFAGGWTCILNRGAPECTYGYSDDAGVLDEYRKALQP